jgi:hypothetical protein
METMKGFVLLLIMVFGLQGLDAQTTLKPPTTQTRQATYCNPINIDYGFCPIPNFVQNGKHRATADPVMAV